MSSALSSRRAAAVAAAAAIGLSAVLSLPGVAAAAPAWDFEITASENTLLPVPDTACGANWELTGAAGGDSASSSGGLGALVTATTNVPTGHEVLVQPGQRGADSDAGGTGGGSGAESSGGAGGAGAGGGGGVSVVRNGNTPPMDVLVAAGGGGGAGSQAAGGAAGSAGGTWTAVGGDYTGGAPGTTDGPGAGGTMPAGGTGTPGAAGAGQDAVAGPVGAGGGGGGGRGNNGGSHAGGSGSSDGTDGSGGGGGGSWAAASPGGTTVTTAADPDGSVRGTWVRCVAPRWSGFFGGATAGDGRLSVEFVAVTLQFVDPTAAVANGWEISVDDGETWEAATTYPAGRLPGAGPGFSRLGVTVTGLENGTTYAVRVRATSTVGTGEESPTLSLTPQAPEAAPPTTPVVAAPTNPISTPPAATPSGVTAPATVPPADGPLTVPGSTVSPGGRITLSGTGFLPGSTVDLYVYSAPTKVGTATADANGAFSATVTLPEGLAAGTHHLVAAGVDASGNPRYLVSAVSVAAASSGGSGLAYTGAEPLPLLAGAGVLLLAGTALVIVGRRRRTA